MGEICVHEGQPLKEYRRLRHPNNKPQEKPGQYICIDSLLAEDLCFKFQPNNDSVENTGMCLFVFVEIICRENKIDLL